MEGMKWFMNGSGEGAPKAVNETVLEAANDNVERQVGGNESVERAEAALELHNSIEAQYGTGEYFGEEARAGIARMNELSTLLRDPEVRAMFEEKLLAARRADAGWVAPSERQVA